MIDTCAWIYFFKSKTGYLGNQVRSTLSDFINAVMAAGKRASSAMDGQLPSVRGAWISAIPAEMTSAAGNLTK